MGQLDLKLRLPSLRPRRKYIQNQLAAVQNLDPHDILKLPDLPRRQVVVEYHNIRTETLHPPPELLGLAFPHVRRGIYPAYLLLNPVNHHRAGALGKSRKLRQLVAPVAPAQNRPHQNGPCLPYLQSLTKFFQVLNNLQNNTTILPYRPTFFKTPDN